MKLILALLLLAAPAYAAPIDDLAAHLTEYTDPTSGALVFRISGANLQLVNGLGSSATHNGAGNLIIGYNETEGRTGLQRIGSHAIIIGRGHEWLDYGCFAQGYANNCLGDYGFVTGYQNTAYDYSAAVSGSNNIAGSNNPSDNAIWTIVAGGEQNQATAYASGIFGGVQNRVATGTTFPNYGEWANIFGGASNLVDGEYGSAVACSEGTEHGWTGAIVGGNAGTVAEPTMWTMIVGGRTLTDSQTGTVLAGPTPHP